MEPPAVDGPCYYIPSLAAISVAILFVISFFILIGIFNKDRKATKVITVVYVLLVLLAGGAWFLPLPLPPFLGGMWCPI